MTTSAHSDISVRESNDVTAVNTATMASASQVGGVVIDRGDDGRLSVSHQILELPSPKADELVVRPSYVGLCGTDIEQIHGRLPESFIVNYPHTLGHEWSGIVVEAGDNVTDFSVGDRVLGHGHLGGNDWFGVTHNGAMSDQFIVPASMCFAVPDNITMKTAAMIEPFACVLQALTKIGGINPSDTVHIYGLGAIGLSAVVQAVTAGASVVVFDPSPLRQELAISLGATAAFNPLETEGLGDRLTENTGRALADVVIEASGVPQAQASAIESADTNGRVLLMGVSGPRPVTALLGLVQSRNLLITSSTGAPLEIWPAAIRYVANAAVDLEPFMTSILPFEQAEEAISRAQAPGGDVKVFLAPAQTGTAVS